MGNQSGREVYTMTDLDNFICYCPEHKNVQDLLKKFYKHKKQSKKGHGQC